MAVPGSLKDIQASLTMLGDEYEKNDVMKSLVEYHVQKFGGPEAQRSSEMVLLEEIDKSTLVEKSDLYGYRDDTGILKVISRKFVLTIKGQNILSEIMSEWLQARRYCLFINEAQVFVDKKSNKVKIKITSLHKPWTVPICNKADLKFLVKVIDEFDDQTKPENYRPVGFKHLRGVIEVFCENRSLLDLTAVVDHVALLSRASLCLLIENLWHNAHKINLNTWRMLEDITKDTIKVPPEKDFRKRWAPLLPPKEMDSRFYDVIDVAAKHLANIPNSGHGKRCETVFGLIAICHHIYNDLEPREYPDEVGRIIFTILGDKLCEFFYKLRQLAGTYGYTYIRDTRALLPFRH